MRIIYESSVDAAWRMITDSGGAVLAFFKADQGSRTYSLLEIAEIPFDILPEDLDEETALERALADRLYSTSDD